ncbi:hypothetical protein O6H91_21G009200 [Diphasiastrum complanatum]|uniref:Uncharacterized protein n=5 Tax=Diphasiastrum complanatum TaxID=34168 RepID=A0ACC2AHS4_DIPCM|nr:hypothetical protein O6H91_21G009200 [Diphasiastrum complanatum]KAJ7517036.1 hypothetical protein O6H91_21G009200 [Diphasiastrum complanatum]KAJ7517040.1 hypothetical protein O6H91_21G009200 [Diphasiastrum complanatum]KAJ7517041.1 hypothetical protein O6H91_21G009200 [Diphasiastrum complanatum]KAJ7517047.1 hypothetical protein O6H91_21G009200 [Diphasiastrum complanatum]
MAQLQVPAPQQQSMQPPQFASTSLYVGDLDATISEAQLYEIFSEIGPLVSIKVCRDAVTRTSLGYAYVNYSNAQDASRALELLNFSIVKGKPMRIMFSHRDPSIRKTGTANIFIKNLDKSIDNKALYDTFSAFGSILSCKVATDPSGQSKGYGFVHFEQSEAAQLAIEKVNGMLLNDKQVYVGPFLKQHERDQKLATKFTNVYVKNLSETTTDEHLKETFGSFGKISSAVVMKDGEGKSKCFGFVNFEHADDAAKAVEALNGKKVDDKEWYVGRAQKKSEREAELRGKYEQERKETSDKFEGVNLYLKNLDDSIHDEKLQELFSEFGNILSCKVMKDPQGQSKGSGFVAFSVAEEASRALTEMNGKMVGSKPIYVAFAQRREDRKAQLQVQFAQMRHPVPVGAHTATGLSMYSGGVPGMGQQILYGQPPRGLISPQAAGFGYQQQLLPGLRPGGPQVPNYLLPVVQRQTPQGPRNSGRGIGPTQQQLSLPSSQQVLYNQQMIQPGGGFRYTTSARSTSDTSVPPQGLQMGGVHVSTVDSGMAQLFPISALASALASAPPEQHRAMLGEQLYPLVDQLEHDYAGKVTGMLLEMDQTEILHLIESPYALKSKVAEAMEILGHAQAVVTVSAPAAQLRSLSLNDPLPS